MTAPAQFDLSLAEVRFGASPRAASSVASRSYVARPIRLAVRGPTGLDYVAAATTRFSVRGRPRALVLVVNRRPRGSLAPDLARIGLTVTSARRLGAPVVWQISDPFTRPSIGLTPALCDLPIHGVSLAASDLRSVLGRGIALSGFSVEAAIAQAYNVVCGRPYEQAFRQAVTQGSGPDLRSGQAIAPLLPAECDLRLAAVPALRMPAPPVRDAARAPTTAWRPHPPARLSLRQGSPALSASRRRRRAGRRARPPI